MAVPSMPVIMIVVVFFPAKKPCHVARLNPPQCSRIGALSAAALRIYPGNGTLFEKFFNFAYNLGVPHFEEAPPGARLLEPRDVLGEGDPGGVDERVADLMRALANPTRIRALFALLEFGELAAGELSKAVKMSPSATSHQLRVLRDLGLVKRRREGRAVIYDLADAHLGVLLRESLYHVDHVRLSIEG